MKNNTVTRRFAARIFRVSKYSFYLHQLVCMKLMFGQKADMGILLGNGKTYYCQTVSDLITCGFVPEKFKVLDHWICYLPRDVLIGR